MPVRVRREERPFPPSLDTLVCALCADYTRREECLRSGTGSVRTRMEYEYLDRRLMGAVRPLVADEAEALLFIEEIGGRIGYAHSRSDLCESTYKERKHAIRLAIAQEMHLYDKEI